MSTPSSAIPISREIFLLDISDDTWLNSASSLSECGASLSEDRSEGDFEALARVASRNFSVK